MKETLDQETARFLPLLPPHLHPHTGLLPPNWEDYPVDPTIPDISDWEPINVMNYFMKQGFPTEQAAVFLNEVSRGVRITEDYRVTYHSSVQHIRTATTF